MIINPRADIVNCESDSVGKILFLFNGYLFSRTRLEVLYENFRNAES